MSLYSRLPVVYVGLSVGFASLLFAQAPNAGGQGGMNYDVRSETTIEGTVDSVETVTAPSGRGRRSMGGTHVVVTAKNGERVEVHLGPTAYLAEGKLAVAKSDVGTILGSRVSMGGEMVMLAREVKKGGSSWTLRDASGRPQWAGGPGPR